MPVMPNIPGLAEGLYGPLGGLKSLVGPDGQLPPEVLAGMSGPFGGLGMGLEGLDIRQDEDMEGEGGDPNES